MKEKKRKETSIDKALRILMVFADSGRTRGMSTQEISEKLNLHKATVSRILSILQKNEFLQKNLRTKKYSLGGSLIRLSSAYMNTLKLDVVNIAEDSIINLRDNVKESVLLEVLSTKSTVIAYIADGLHRVRLAGQVGDNLPLNAAAGAKAILAYLPQEAVEEYTSGRKFERFTSNTIIDKEKFFKQLEEIKRSGVSFDVEEIDYGTFAIGSPIFNYNSKPVAAVVIAGPIDRVRRNLKKYKTLLKETSKEISERLHYRKEANF